MSKLYEDSKEMIQYGLLLVAVAHAFELEELLVQEWLAIEIVVVAAAAKRR